MSDGRVWNVLSYPNGAVLHTTDTYDEADRWRTANDRVSYICPEWPQSAAPVSTPEEL